MVTPHVLGISFQSQGRGLRLLLLTPVVISPKLQGDQRHLKLVRLAARAQEERQPSPYNQDETERHPEALH